MIQYTLTIHEDLGYENRARLDHIHYSQNNRRTRSRSRRKMGTGTGTGMGMGMRTGLGLGVRRCGAEHRGPRTEDSE